MTNDKREATPNPYRFTVEVRTSQGREMQWWHVDVLDKYGDRIGVGSDHLSKAEACAEVELIRRAMWDAVLDMPEMQAIRKALRAFAEGEWNARPRHRLAVSGLPEHVIDWVYPRSGMEHGDD